MDQISRGFLAEFVAAHDLDLLPEDKRFDHFSAYVTTRVHYREPFDTHDIVVGGDGDGGIDAVAMLANGTLITDIDDFNDLAKNSGSLDVTFIFVQATTSSSFDGSKIGDFGRGVLQFFNPNRTIKFNAEVTAAVEVKDAILKQVAKFTRSNPACWLYYVSTGKWNGDRNLQDRIDAVQSDLRATNLFERVEFEAVDAARLQSLYRQTQRAMSRKFTFAKRISLPKLDGVEQSYLGVLPATDFIKLLQDDNGEIVLPLFYDNVRGLQKNSSVNGEIQKTLESPERARFMLMNNGVTIIAKGLRPFADEFTIEDYSIVNGCQTSHVLFGQRDNLDSVMVPVRLIHTTNDAIIKSIIHSTNRQTAITQEQFYALDDFPRKLRTVLCDGGDCGAAQTVL
jgi:hypothetical protein